MQELIARALREAPSENYKTDPPKSVKKEYTDWHNHLISCDLGCRSGRRCDDGQKLLEIAEAACPVAKKAHVR